MFGFLNEPIIICVNKGQSLLVVRIAMGLIKWVLFKVKFQRETKQCPKVQSQIRAGDRGMVETK